MNVPVSRRQYNSNIRAVSCALCTRVGATGDAIAPPAEVFVRRPLTLVAVGDLQLGDSPTTVGYGFFSRYRGTALDALFDEIRPALAGADILFGNLETTLVPPPSGESRRDVLQLRGEVEFAAALRRVGFTVLNVANNHAVQHGDDTFHATVDSVRAAGIACCGVRGTGPWTTEPAILEVNGATVGVLGYSLRPRQYGPATPPYAEGDRESICRDVARLRASGAIVVVSLHWGEEFVPVPSHDEIELGHAIIDAGAACLLGHHPHVTRPVERYAKGLIAYSLGNLMGDMIWHAPFRRGMVLRCALDGDEAVAASTVDTHLGDDYRPVRMPGADDAPVPAGAVRGLSAVDYAREVDRTVHRQRLDSYRSAILNLPRTPLRILTQLVADTVRNKCNDLISRD
jgi:poly-gamma-glutamate synthesis protein (capsule biosynthesis protein)